MKTYFLAVTFKDVQIQNVPLTSKMAKNKFNVVNQCGRKNGQICTSCFPTHLILSDSGLSTVWPSQGLSWGALTLQQLLLKMYQFPQKKEGQKLRVTAWIIGITEKTMDGMGTHLNERSILENNNTCLRTFEYHFLRMSFTQFYYDVLGSAVANAISLGVANRALFFRASKEIEISL